jgi:probable HAF family extracellular repeat protein
VKLVHISTRRSKLAFLILAFVVSYGSDRMARADTRYIVTDLGTLAANTTPDALGINDSGIVVGSVDGTAFRWTSQTGMQNLGIPAGFDSARAVAVNSSGQIAISATGTIFPNQFSGHAFRWTAGQFTDLGTLGGTFSIAYGIDGSGRVSGYAYTTGGSIHAYRSTSSNTLVDIDSLGGDYSLGYGINASGQVVGQAYTAAHQYHAFVWNGTGPMIDLGTLGGTQSTANDISDSGAYIVGDSSTSASAYHAFFDQNGNLLDLGSLSSNSSYGTAVNNSGVVIGSYTDDQNYSHPYVWDISSGMRDLNSLLDPVTGAGWTLYEVNDLNNLGQIVGQGQHNGVTSAFLLTPVPEPSSLALLSLGSLAVGCCWRSRATRLSRCG